MNYLKLVLLSIIFASLISCSGGNKDKNSKKNSPPVSVEVMVASEKDFPNKIEINGNVLSDEMVELHPEISGRIVYLNIPDGARVGKGTILAKINDADLQAQLLQQKVQLDLATKTEQRLKKLLEVNGVNQADYDLALSQLNGIEANIKVLNAQIDKTVIRAPFSGQLGLRLISNGAYVSPQTLIGTLHQSDNVKIDFDLPEAYGNLLKIGGTVDIKTTTSEEIFVAAISAIEPQINTATRNIKVRARLNSGKINPGSFVKVLVSKKGKAIVVPTNAIIPDALSNQVVIVKNGKAVFKNVETGFRTEDVVEIVDGLKTGDSVVVSGVLFVRPNAPVKVKKAKKK